MRRLFQPDKTQFKGRYKELDGCDKKRLAFRIGRKSWRCKPSYPTNLLCMENSCYKWNIEFCSCILQEGPNLQAAQVLALSHSTSTIQTAEIELLLIVCANWTLSSFGFWLSCHTELDHFSLVYEYGVSFDDNVDWTIHFHLRCRTVKQVSKQSVCMKQQPHTVRLIFFSG